MLKRVSAMYSHSSSSCNKPSVVNTPTWDGLNADSLEKVIEDEINLAQEFLADHQYYSSYGYIQHPKVVPLHILAAFLEILHSSGPYCADVAASVLLEDLEKLKEGIIPDNRHLLLLTMVSTVLHKIRAIIKNTFRMYSEKETLYKFSAAKILKVFDILRKFKPNISFTQHQHLFAQKGGNNIENNACFCKTVENEMGDCVPPSKWRNSYSGISQNGMGDFVSPSSPRSVCKSLAYFKLQSDLIDNMGHFTGTCKASQAQYMSWKNRKENFCSQANAPSNSYSCVRNASELEPYQKQHHRNFNIDDESKLNGIIFVKDRLTANVLYQVFDNLQFLDDDFAFLVPRCLDDHAVNRAINWDKASFAGVNNMGNCKDGQDRLRLQQYNLLIATSSVGNNINVKCGLVLHYHNSPA